ncbi:hypothetical protein KQI86_19485 [Clostridium sp. MSJ-11]|uniref:Uncharacterized protein n=1 Tax=Clostridium mobile TaxID=2841512 RepID=A0ABS6ENZ5_9CLOT|nr:hypothetical protein [Clostridium mobile]MBU5486487.1 hypothetical protein [Clostridium mobile]
MYCIKAYKDLITEIELTKMRIEGLEKERELYKKTIYGNAPKEISGQSYSDMPRGSRNYMSLDRIIEAISRIDSALYIEEERLKILQELENGITSKLEQLSGLHYKVYYLKEIEGKTYREIAEELYISEQYAKELGAEAKRNNKN